MSGFDKESIIEALRDAASDGYLSVKDYKSYRARTDKECPSYVTVIRAFDSWREALLAAGLKTGRPDELTSDEQNQYRRQRAIASIKAFSRANPDVKCTRQKYDEWASSNDDVMNPAYIITTMGSWNKALQESGMSINRVSPASSSAYYNDDDIMRFVKDAMKHGVDTRAEYDLWRKNHPSDDVPSFNTVVNRFGSWNNAKNRARS